MAGLTAARRRLRPTAWSEAWVAGAFVTPAALVILLIVAFPLVRACAQRPRRRPDTAGEEPFFGLANYADG